MIQADKILPRENGKNDILLKLHLSDGAIKLREYKNGDKPHTEIN